MDEDSEDLLTETLGDPLLNAGEGDGANGHAELPLPAPR